jgi:uncharacterized membrane protein YraQ (UPF0718 family)
MRCRLIFVWIFIAGVLSVLIPQKMVEKHLGGNGILPVIKAVVLGVPLPYALAA